MKKVVRKCGRQLAVLLALVLTLGMFSATKVYAGSPFGDMPATQVNYRHNGGHSYEVQDPEWVQVYCLDPAKGYSDKKANQNIRWKIDFWANSWILNNNEQDVNGSNKPTPEQLNRLVSILWHAKKMNASIDDTQNAVWFFVTNGGDNNYAGNVSKYNNYIVKAAGDSNWAMPASFQLYFYAADTQAYGFNTIQNMVRLETSDNSVTNPPEPPAWKLSTAVEAAGQRGTAESPIIIQLEPGQETTDKLYIEDKIQYSNMAAEAGHQIWMIPRIMKLNEDGTTELVRWRVCDEFGSEYYINNGATYVDASGAGEWGSENITGFYNNNLAPGTYYMAVEVYDANTGVSMVLDDPNDKAETSIIKPAGPTYEPKVTNTTARAKQGSGEEVSASGTEAAKITVPHDEDINVTISDVVEFEGLNPEKAYTLKSYIWYDGSKKQEKITELPAGATSPITVTFDQPITVEKEQCNISNELYEKGSDVMITEHNGDRKIVSERVTITKEEKPQEPTNPEEPKPEEPTTPEEPKPEEPTNPDEPTPEEPEQPADDRVPSMKTTVSVNDKTGSPLEITGEEALEVTEVKDTVNYGGLLTDAQYTISGKLVKVEADGSYNAEDAVSTAEVTFTPAAADGSEVLTFPVEGGLDLESTYVVLETLTSADGKDNKIPEGGLVHPENVSEEDEDAKAQMVKTGKVDAPITPQGNPEEEPTTPSTDNKKDNNSKTSNSNTNTSKTSSNALKANSATGSSAAQAPKTGDESGILASLFALAAAAGIMGVLIRKKRNA